MKFLSLLSMLITLNIQAGSIFTRAHPSDAPQGIVYDVKQVPVRDKEEFLGKRIGILAAHGVQESELTYPYEYFKRRGAHVDIIIPSWSEGKVLGVSYLRPTIWIQGSFTFKEAMAVEYDALILTGGSWKKINLPLIEKIFVS